MKDTTLTITDEKGNSMTLSGSTLNNMIIKQVKMYERMMEKKMNNPYLTKEELTTDITFLKGQIEEVKKLIPMTYEF